MEQEKGISFFDILVFIKKHLIFIIATFVIFCVSGLSYSIITDKDSYYSNINFYVTYNGESDSSNINSINYGRLAAKTFAEAINSDSNLWKRIEVKANSDIYAAYGDSVKAPTYTQIGSSISAKYDESLESMIFSVKYTSSDKRIVAPLLNATIDVLKELTTVDNSEENVFKYYKVGTFGYVNEEDVYNNPSKVKNITIISALCGLFIGIAGSIIYECSSHKIRNIDDIERVCDIRIIGQVPDLPTESEEK